MSDGRLAIEKIRERFGEAVIVETRDAYNEITIVISRAAILDVARFLRDEPSLEYNFLSDICGVDWPNREERLDVVYNLYSIKHGSRLRLKVRVPEKDPSVASVIEVWPTANWHEREAFDLFGIRFAGHPDLRRILNPDDFGGFPYRKDFPIR